jgi:E1A/CREB-binding protein
MKRLWKHIAECKNQKCLVPHCVSSRYVLSHYHRCKDVRCPVCGPVREAIHRSHEKQKQMQALKQRHQQAVQQQQQTLQSGATAGGAVPAQPGSLTQAGGVMSAQSSVGTVSGPGVAVAEPPLKRQRTGQEVSLPSFQAQGGPQRILQQPTAVRAGSMSSHASSALSQPPAFALSAPGSGVAARPQVATAPGIAFSNGQVIMPKHTGPKPQEDHTLINCFSVEQIETHIASLSKGLQLPPLKLKTKCLEVLKVLQSHQHGWVFNSPVDPVELGLPDYFEVIKKPMDLGTIRKRLDNGVYHTLEEFEGHVHQTFDNAMMYNPEGSVVYNMAKEMKVKFEHDYEKLMHQLNLEEDEKRKNGEACLLCGCEKLQFEPPVFYCNGHNCASKRIRRNSYYYVAGNNQYHWCHQCYQELKDNSTIDLGETSVKKESLAKKKNDETHEESWVQCDRCERWVHQICALFNTRQNKDQRSEYACPKCTIIERKNNGQLEAISSTPMAEDLPRTLLSEYLENHVRVKVNEFVKKKAQQAAAAEGITIEEATKKVQMGGPISIRQVTSMDRKLEVRECMKVRYAFRNYPDEFTFRCKCIVVFQNLDGVDVMLFGLYVYEHNEKNPLPNKRAVYISYLDSVYYMRPRQMRTFIYHEILIAYLDYVRRRGFATAHIWACPPLKGDDYILYAKPEDQKTPKDDRLRQWYIDMLIECQMRGIVGKLTNMYDLYFSDPSNDATVVPYMDGDYFPAEVENIIKDIEEGKSGKSSNVQGKKKDKQKQKKKSGRAGTRSAGLDEDALRASGILPPGIDQKSLQDGGRDYVMTKLGEIIQPMKESFIVAFLAWSGAKEDDMIVPKEIQDFREKNGVSWKINDSDQVDATDASSVSGGDCEAATATTAAETPSPQAESGAPPVEVKTESQTEATPVSQAERASSEGPMEVDAVESAPPSVVREAPPAQLDSSDPVPPKDEVMNHDDEAANAAPPPTPSDVYSSSTAAASDAAVPTSVESSTATPSETSAFVTAENAASDPSNQVVPNMVLREGKFAAMQARKRDIEGNSKPAEPEDASSDKPEKEPRSITVRDSKGREVKVVDDDIEELDCEFLNNRQAFLNLCQGNHYQFDQLRRAKHSSMMVLWHLHNRDAPKFVQQCATCSREILQGYRFHCSTCADFDQCQECYQNPNFPRHPHPLKPRPVGTGRESELTAAQRAERQRSIQLHMTLLLHAATCNSPKCPSANCTKMKGLLKHGTQCQIKASGGCNVCKRIWALLQIHARQCKMVQCPVPSCLLIRERIRQLKMQQQAMDDRRRQEMNRAYRGKR